MNIKKIMTLNILGMLLINAVTSSLMPFTRFIVRKGRNSRIVLMMLMEDPPFSAMMPVMTIMKSSRFQPDLK
jgi:hypothetical protein